jgi:hypothetical protein
VGVSCSGRKQPQRFKKINGNLRFFIASGDAKDKGASPQNRPNLLNGKTALVTGGTSGSGYYTALALACRIDGQYFQSS